MATTSQTHRQTSNGSTILSLDEPLLEGQCGKRHRTLIEQSMTAYLVFPAPTTQKRPMGFRFGLCAAGPVLCFPTPTSQSILLQHPYARVFAESRRPTPTTHPTSRRKQGASPKQPQADSVQRPEPIPVTDNIQKASHHGRYGPGGGTTLDGPDNDGGRCQARPQRRECCCCACQMLLRVRLSIIVQLPQLP